MQCTKSACPSSLFVAFDVQNYYGPYGYCSLDKGVAYTRGGGVRAQLSPNDANIPMGHQGPPRQADRCGILGVKTALPQL